VRESCTREIGKENGHLECGLERERAEKTDGVEGQGEERDLAERENERGGQKGSRMGTAKSKAETATRKKK